MEEIQKAISVREVKQPFHTKMELLQRQAYGFRNFNNYRLRIRIMGT